jgi:predicted nucleic acid-binding protein
MSRILLDTSAYSAFMRGNPKIKSAIQRADEIYLNPIVLGELLAGFLRGNNERKNREELQELLASPRAGTVSLDEETSERYAVILSDLRDKGTPVPTNDIWIAATAMQHGLKILTTDSHYEKISQVITEWYDVQ